MRTIGCPYAEIFVEGSNLYLRDQNEKMTALLFPIAENINNLITTTVANSGRIFAAPTDDEAVANRSLIIPAHFLIWKDSVNFHVDPIDDRGEKWILLTMEENGAVALCNQHRFYSIKGGEVTYAKSYEEYDIKLLHEDMFGPTPSWHRADHNYRFADGDWRPLLQDEMTFKGFDLPRQDCCDGLYCEAVREGLCDDGK